MGFYVWHFHLKGHRLFLALRINLCILDDEKSKMEGHIDFVLSVAFSPNGKWIVDSANESVQVWDASSSEELKRLEGHTGAVQSVAFSFNGKWIVSGSSDQSV